MSGRFIRANWMIKTQRLVMKMAVNKFAQDTEPVFSIMITRPCRSYCARKFLERAPRPLEMMKHIEKDQVRE